MRPRRIVAVASPVVFVVLARRAARGTVSVKEEKVFRLLNKPKPLLRWPVWAVMQAGSFAAIPIAAALALRKDRAAALALAIDGTGVWALCKLIKRVVKRGRPVVCLDAVVVVGKTQRGRGFPSGHAAVATTLTMIGARLLPRPASRFVWAVPVLVGAGRQFVGAHLPLDVAGGTVLGVTAGSLANLALDTL